MLIKLRAQRVKKLLSQKEIAKMCNVAESTYNLWENEKRDIPKTKIDAILKILGCKYEDIFIDDEEDD